MKTIFLSHSNSDKPFVRRLASALEASGLRVWLDETDIRPGDSLARRLEAGIQQADVIAVVLSPNAVASGWVRQEVESAIVEEITKNRIAVVPILYRDCDIPPFLRTRVWVDFRGVASSDELFDQRVSLLLRYFDKPTTDSESESPAVRVHSRSRATIRAVILYPYDGSRYDVELPLDVTVDRVIDELTRALQLPRSFANGVAVFYKIEHKRTGRTLLGHQTVRVNDVLEGDVLVLVVQTLAG